METIKMKNVAAPAVKREEEEDWRRRICRRGHAKEPSGRCKECERLTYERLAAARTAEGLTARGRPRYSLRTHCLHGHLRSDNEVRRKTNGTPYCRVCNLESMRRHRQRRRLLIQERL
jgi:hypothetical protein